VSILIAAGGGVGRWRRPG